MRRVGHVCRVWAGCFQALLPPSRVLRGLWPSRAPAHSGKGQVMARGGQPGYSPKLGWSKSPRFVSAGRPDVWSLGGPVVLTHTQWGSLAPGLYSFLGTPAQSLLTPPLRTQGKRTSYQQELTSLWGGEQGRPPGVFPRWGSALCIPTDPCGSPDFLQLPLLRAESQALPAPSQKAVPLPCTASGGKSCPPLACECLAPSPYRILSPLALLSFPLLHTQSLSGLSPPLLFPKGVKAADQAEG